MTSCKTPPNGQNTEQGFVASEIDVYESSDESIPVHL